MFGSDKSANSILGKSRKNKPVLKIDDHIRHARFGFGKIVRVDNRIVWIKFRSKRMILALDIRFAPIRKVEWV